MLTFVVGAAFAFTPGILDINSNIHIAPRSDMYVVWTNVIGGENFRLLSEITPAGAEYGAQHTARIVHQRDRRAQRIYWNMFFSSLSESGLAFASITAEATNHSIHLAEITGFRVINSLVDGFSIDDFGLTVEFDTTGFVGAVLDHGDSTNITIYVFWDGTIPQGFEIDTESIYTLASHFIIEFDYAPVA